MFNDASTSLYHLVLAGSKRYSRAVGVKDGLTDEAGYANNLQAREQKRYAIILRGHMWGPGIWDDRSHAVAGLAMVNRACGSHHYAVDPKTGLRLLDCVDWKAHDCFTSFALSTASTLYTFCSVLDRTHVVMESKDIEAMSAKMTTKRDCHRLAPPAEMLCVCVWRFASSCFSGPFGGWR